MGQYHMPVCVDTMEQINPHRFGDGLKLMEFGCSGSGTMAALGLLLVGEGRWAGDRIGILPHIVPVGGENFTDISLAVREAMVASNEGTYEDNDDGTVTRTSRW